MLPSLLAVGAQAQDAPDTGSSIPGIPGEDYPLLAVPLETSFICEGREVGYYADPEGECQQFHICVSDGINGPLKFSFLCPNGTLFNQQYFICDWWFNVDCSQVTNTMRNNICYKRKSLKLAKSNQLPIFTRL